MSDGENNITSVVEQNVVTSDRLDTSVVVVPTDEQVLVVSEEVSVATLEETHTATVETKDVVVVASGQSGPPGAKGDVGDQGPQGPQGPQGSAGPAGAGAATPVRVLAPDATSVEVERLSAAIYRSTKWIVTVSDPLTNRFRVGEILAFHNGAEAHHTHYAIFGDVIQYDVDVFMSGGDMVFRVTNSDVNPLTVDAVRVGNLLV